MGNNTEYDGIGRKDTSVLGRHNLCCGKIRSLLWLDKVCVVARQVLCSGKTRSLLWQDIREAAFGRLHKGGRRLRRRPPLWIPLCLATTEILSCHNTHLVLPRRRSCLAQDSLLRRYYDTIRTLLDTIRTLLDTFRHH